MNLTLFLIGFVFSLFYLILGYWKEDFNLHFIGSISLLMTAMFLFTGIQVTEIVTPHNATLGNYTTVVKWEGSFYEGMGIGILIAVFDVIQMFYFSARYREPKEV